MHTNHTNTNKRRPHQPRSLGRSLRGLRLSGWLALILVVLLSIAYPSYIQSELNKVWLRVGTPLPGQVLPTVGDEMPRRLPDPPPSAPS